MKPPEPILVGHLFPEATRGLVELLRALSDSDWRKPTVCPEWTVKDVSAHILDGYLRRLSFQRDGSPPPQPATTIAGYRDLVGYLNRLNAQWVEAASRLSPRILTELLETAGEELCLFIDTLDPFQAAFHPVSWAGETESLNWFDIAREFTEQWHHQQQIRQAVGRPGLMERRHLAPVLDTFMRALPHTYRNLEAEVGCGLVFHIRGESGDDWSLRRAADGWELLSGAIEDPVSRVIMEPDTAWRLFSKGLTPEEAGERIIVEGNQDLGRGILGLLAIMA